MAKLKEKKDQQKEEKERLKKEKEELQKTKEEEESKKVNYPTLVPPCPNYYNSSALFLQTSVPTNYTPESNLFCSE